MFSINVPMTREEWERLPGRFGWKREYLDGHAHLTLRVPLRAWSRFVWPTFLYLKELRSWPRTEGLQQRGVVAIEDGRFVQSDDLTDGIRLSRECFGTEDARPGIGVSLCARPG